MTQRRRYGPIVVLLGAVLGVLAIYGGTRSPDEEIVFKTAVSLAAEGSFALREDRLHDWGTPRGRDGRRYAVFGPGTSLALAPFVAVGRWVNRTGWYEDASVPLPASHQIGDGLHSFMTGEPLGDRAEHALRFLASPFNVVVTCLTALVLMATLHRLGRSRRAAAMISIVYLSATPAWHYAGTFFSEPATTLFVLLSFLLLLPGPDRTRRSLALRRLGSGLALGAAVATHVSALLFVPFFLVLAVSVMDRRDRAATAAAFGAGLGAVLLLLLAFNQARFGSPWETGRTVDPRWAYGTFVAPWRGLFGLTVSPGKGLALYCPLAVVGAILWWRWARKWPLVAGVTAVAIAARILFIAARSDWAGGFCVGPRYLMPLLPFFTIPIAFLLDAWLRRPGRVRIALFIAATVALVAQQWSFVLGEFHSFYQYVRMQASAAGVDLFEGDRIFLSGETTPLTHLLDGARGPFLLKGLEASTGTLWWAGWLVTAGLVAGALAWIAVGRRTEAPPVDS